MQVTIGERLQELAMRAQNLFDAIEKLESSQRVELMKSYEYKHLMAYADDVRKRVLK
jgi:hypothetical protein